MKNILAPPNSFFFGGGGNPHFTPPLGRPCIPLTYPSIPKPKFLYSYGNWILFLLKLKYIGAEIVYNMLDRIHKCEN